MKKQFAGILMISLFFLAGWNHTVYGEDLVPDQGNEPVLLTPLQVTASSELEPYYSSLPPYSLYTYYASYIDDWDPDTAWNEGAAGPGTGECLELVYPEGTVLKGLLVYPGFYSTKELFYQNNAPTTLKISCGDTAETVSVGSYAEEWQEGFQGMYTDLETPISCRGPVRVTIENIRPGNTYNDTCISELHFYGYPAEGPGSQEEPAEGPGPQEEQAEQEPTPGGNTIDDFEILTRMAADVLHTDVLVDPTVPMDWQLAFTELNIPEVTARHMQTSGVLGCCRADLDTDGEEELLALVLYGGDEPQLVIAVLENSEGAWRTSAEYSLPAGSMLFSANSESGSACVFCDLSADGCTIWFAGNTGPGLFATGGGTWILAPYIYRDGTITEKSEPYTLQGILRDLAQGYLLSGHMEAGTEQAAEIVEALRSIHLCPDSFSKVGCTGFPIPEGTQRCLAVDLSYTLATPYEEIMNWYMQGIQESADIGTFAGTGHIITRIVLPDPEPENANSEDELRQLFANAVPDPVLYFLYDDYDYNGTCEAFAVTEQPGNPLYAVAYFIASDGSVSRLTQNEELWGYEFQDSANVRQRYMVDTGTQKFYIWENCAGGSGSLSRVFGVRGGVPYEPQISSHSQTFRQEGSLYVSEESDFSQGFHDYIRTTYTFDPNTGEFLRD